MDINNLPLKYKILICKRIRDVHIKYLDEKLIDKEIIHRIELNKVDQAFAWADTSEGWKFWEKIYFAKNRKELPIYEIKLSPPMRKYIFKLLTKIYISNENK